MTQLPDQLSYALRYPGELRRTGKAINPLFFNWRTDFYFPQFQPGGARNWESENDGIPAGYYLEGFLFIQNFIFQAFMELKNSLNIDLATIPTVKIQVRINFN
jgi:ATP-binding cassette, subfamily A (ABC1), member 3